jgi:MATE family multidrug resistance protein
MKRLKQQLKRWGPVFRLAWPLIVANSFWNLQMTIDRMFLGQHSTAALGASVAVMTLFWTPMALLQQTSAYVTTFVAQYKGSGRPEQIGPSFWMALYVGLLGGLLFLLMIPASGWLFSFFGHSESMQTLESQYFSAICFSALPTAVVAAVSGLFTGLGRTRIIMVINGVGMVANVLFDYLMIFGNWGFPALGVEGAGYATALANFSAAIFGLIYLFTRPRGEMWNLFEGWAWNSEFFVRYLKYGVPSGMQWALEGLSFAVFLILIGQLPNGDAALTASSIASTIFLLAALPPIGIGQAVSALVGDHLGHNKPRRAVRDTWAGFQMAFLYILIMCSTFVLVPDFYLGWFENTEDPKAWAAVAALVPTLLIFVAVFCLFDNLNYVVGFALKGAGDTRYVFLVALIVPWPLMVLPTWLVRDMPQGLFWAWFAATIYVIVQDSLYLIRFLGGKWQSMRVTQG